jgi:HSP20 family protein
MSRLDNSTRVLSLLVAVLTAAVLGLGYMLFETNQELRVIAAAQPPERANAPQQQPGDDNAIRPRGAEESGDPFSVFGEPFGSPGWDPFREMDAMHRRIDAMFDSAFRRFGQSSQFSPMLEGTFTPRMDLKDEGDRYVVQLDIPGAVEPEIKVNLNGNTLTVEAATTVAREQQEGGEVLQRERRTGRYVRQITLPEPVDMDSIESQYEDGIFTVTIRKAADSE